MKAEHPGSQLVPGTVQERAERGIEASFGSPGLQRLHLPDVVHVFVEDLIGSHSAHHGT